MTLSIPFVKMNGLGNDIVVLDGRAAPTGLVPDAIRRLSPREGGIGFDQVVTLEPDPEGADVFMRIANADGGEVEACGNAARCIADRLLTESGAAALSINTLGGRLRAHRRADGIIAVDMGKARFGWADIPLARDVGETDRVGGVAAAEQAGIGAGSVVNVGNPHIVYWVDDPASVDLGCVGPMIEHDPLFPRRINVTLARVVDRGRVDIRVWERGAGMTRACGTAACATGVLALRTGRTGPHVTIGLPGGDIEIAVSDDGTIVMAGAVAVDFTGFLDPTAGTFTVDGAAAAGVAG
ncbi:diaminopimelate epimerase [Amorphus coralli]|uniref:diaminopimelate epimerase n=1 Tax=Amorphus coralli TaxID=340680 RepID=UPI000365CBBA|nr:diaminopimelate epimerase [Amorphus coralli]